MKKTIAALALVALALPGCASLNNAGTASYTVKPFVDKSGETHCCEVAVFNGKEIASLDALIEYKPADGYKVHLVEKGVAAFQGQEIAAGAAQQAAHDAVKAALVAGGVLIAPYAAPVIGGGLAAGGLPAAAIGAAGGAAAAKATQP